MIVCTTEKKIPESKLWNLGFIDKCHRIREADLNEWMGLLQPHLRLGRGSEGEVYRFYVSEDLRKKHWNWTIFRGGQVSVQFIMTWKLQCTYPHTFMCSMPLSARVLLLGCCTLAYYVLNVAQLLLTKIFNMLHF